MDLSLLRALRSMKKIDDEDPSFRTENADLASVEPTYPNVVVVDQKAADGDPLDQTLGSAFYKVQRRNDWRMELITNSLTSALIIATNLTSTRSRWSVVLKEGLYVDPDFRHLSSSSFPGDACFEIVGLKDVRILHSAVGAFEQLPLKSGRLTMKNLRLYDRRCNRFRGFPFFILESGSRMEFVDVKINVPDVLVLALEKGSAASMERCALNGCLLPLQTEGGSVRLEDCRLSHCGTQQFRTAGVGKGGSLTATKVRFTDCSKIMAWMKSRSVFNDCRFELKTRRHYSQYASLPPSFVSRLPPSKRLLDFALFEVCGGATIECEGCEFRGYAGVATVMNSDSKVTLKRCRLSELVGVARIRENASMEVVDSHVHAGHLLEVGFNVEGDVKFLRNALHAASKPIFLIDEMSKKPKHDLPNPSFVPTRFNQAVMPKDKERSSYTKSAVADRTKRPMDRTTPKLDETFMKHCEMCWVVEGQGTVQARQAGNAVAPVKKFQFCANCREVCYCSKECQKRHWPDHKLSCNGSAARKK